MEMAILSDISLTLNVFGTIIAIAGAAYNAKGHHKFAQVLWSISNAILVVLFAGVAMGLFVLNGAAWLQVILHIIFGVTSVYGYWRLREKEKQHGNKK